MTWMSTVAHTDERLDIQITEWHQRNETLRHTGKGMRILIGRAPAASELRVGLLRNPVSAAMT
jgi:hypothetical protein